MRGLEDGEIPKGRARRTVKLSSAGVIAVLGKLRARRNWFRIACEYWRDDPPSTELGRLDREFFAVGQR